MLKLISILVLCLFVVTACGADEAPPATSPTESNRQSDGQVADAPSDLTLGQTIESETGVTYQLPSSWVVDDNASVSNFASDQDAQLDALNLGSPESRRWMVLGSVGLARPGEIMGLAEATSFEEAAARLHEYYNTADFSMQSPGTWEPFPGQFASTALGVNPDRPGWATQVYYIDTDTENYIVIFFETPANIIMQISNLRDEIALSATLR